MGAPISPTPSRLARVDRGEALDPDAGKIEGLLDEVLNVGDQCELLAEAGVRVARQRALSRTESAPLSAPLLVDGLAMISHR